MRVAIYLSLLLFVSTVLCQAEFCKTIAEPCEQKACALACAECQSGCLVLESFPAQYSCQNPARTFDVYDVCPDFNPFPSNEIPPPEPVAPVEHSDHHGHHGHSGESNESHEHESHEHGSHEHGSHEHGSDGHHSDAHHNHHDHDDFSSASVITGSVVAIFIASIVL